MKEITEHEERDAIDNITNTMFSVAFLNAINDFIFSSNRNKLTVGQFYDNWKSSFAEIKLPLSPGIMLGELYVAIVYGKEIWFDVVPDARARMRR